MKKSAQICVGGRRLHPHLTSSILLASVFMMTMIGALILVDENPVEVMGQTSGTYGSNLSWTLDSDGVLSITGTGPMEDTDVIDSEKWGGEVKTVIIGDGITSIGNNVFADCSSMISIDIGNSVTSIGRDAFGGCISLTSVVLPDSVTEIGQWAFQNCTSLTEFTIPSSVKSIGDAPFAGCRSLAGIEVVDINAAFCSVDGVLFDKEGSTLIQYPSGRSGSAYSVPDSVETI